MPRFLSPSYQSPKIVKVNGINLGAGEGIFFGISGNSLQFKSLIAGTDISFVVTDDDITINGTFVDATTASNLGTGDGIFASEVGDDLQFKSLKAGAGITLTSSATEIVVESTASGAGEANTSSSLGVGVSFVAPKSGVNLPFRSLLSSAGLTWSQQTDTVTIDLQAGLISIAGLTTSANKGIYTTGSDTYATFDLSVFGRSLSGAADDSAARVTLGLGTASTRDATTSATDTTSERLWRTNDLVKNTSETDTTAARIVRNGDHGLGTFTAPLLTNLDTQTSTGFFAYSSGPTGSPGYNFGTIQVGARSVNETTQIAIGLLADRMSFRRRVSAIWQSWMELWHSGNLVKQTSTFDNTPGSVLLVGAGGILGTGAGVADFNSDLASGLYGVNTSGVLNAYGASYSAASLFQRKFDANICTQLVQDRNNGDTWTRVKSSGIFQSWRKLWDTGNFDPTLKANLASPVFTGTPEAPTQAAGTNNARIATTAFAAGKTKVITTRSGTSYTFVITDTIDVYNRFTNGAATTCTVPPNSSVAFPIGHVISIRRAAAANLTLTPGAFNVTLNAPAGGTLVMINNMTVELIKVATDTWDVVGQTVST